MSARQGELLSKPKHRIRGQLMHVCDAGGGCENGLIVQMRCTRCGYESGWLQFDTVTEAKRGLPCPECAATPPAGTEG